MSTNLYNRHMLDCTTKLRRLDLDTIYPKYSHNYFYDKNYI